MHGNRPIALEALLASAPLFEGLGQEALARVARYASDVRLGKHDLLFEAGSPSDGFYLVIHGQIKLFLPIAPGNEKIVEIQGQGQTFGETLMFSGQPSVVSARALADSWLVYVPKAAILAELEADSGLRMRLLAQMSSHLHGVISSQHCDSRQSGTQRFIAYLLRLLPEPEQAGHDVVVKLPTSKGNISSLLNLTKEHLSRILRTLSQRGLIAVTGCRILIPDVAQLIGYRDGESMS